MKPFKSQEELEKAKEQFIKNGATELSTDVSKGNTSTSVVDYWSASTLKKLSQEELLFRLDQVDNQATLMKWRIWWVIRQKYPSNVLFGQYISSLKDTIHADCVNKQQDIHRSWTAGKFCERYNITDLNKAKISQSAIYELSRSSNEDISGGILSKVRGKNLGYKEVLRLIGEAKAIEGEVLSDTAVVSPEVVTPAPTFPGLAEMHLRPVQKFEVLQGKVLDFSAIGAVGRKVEPVLSLSEVDSVDLEGDDGGDGSLDEVQEVREFDSADGDMLLELASHDASMLTEEQMIGELLLFSERYHRSPIKLVALFKEVMKVVQKGMY
jgi:hypothetical protein